MTKQPYVIVTGATGAIGRQICQIIYLSGKNLILACRNTSKAEALAYELRQLYAAQQHEIAELKGKASTGDTGDATESPTPAPSIIILRLDLTTQEDTLRALHVLGSMVKGGKAPSPADAKMAGGDKVVQVDSAPIKITALINNAGVMCRDFTLNKEGVETTLAVNFFNTREFTKGVTELMEAGSQVVFTTSITRIFHRHYDRVPTVTKENFSQLGTYGLSKRLITDFAASIARDYDRTGIRVNCADPWIVDSDMITLHRWFDPIANVLFRPFIRTPHQGAIPALRAFSNSFNGKIFCRWRIKSLIEPEK